MHPKINLTNEALKQKLAEIYALETKETPIILYKDYPQLYHVCRANYGSVKDALEQLGINYINCHKSQKWSVEKIEEELMILLDKQNKGEYFDFSKDYQPLRSACRRYFGSVEEAATFFGLLGKLNFVKGKRKHSWNNDRQLVIDTLKKLFKQKPQGYPYFYEKEKALSHACFRIIGSVKDALIEANIPLNWIKVYPTNNLNKKTSDYTMLTKEETIKELQRIFIEEKITITEARKKHSFIFKMVDRHFESFSEALFHAEIKHEDILVKNERNAGILAEKKIVDAIFNELGIDYSKGHTSKLRPDFVFKHTWGDAKISYYDKNGWDKTIKKYKPHTKQLTIIYIFGPDLGLHLVTSKVLAAHINYYIKQLPKHRQIYYRELLEEIRQFYQSSEINKEEVMDLYTNFKSELQVEKSLGKVTFQKENFSFSIQSETWQQSFLKLLDFPLDTL